MSKRNPKPHPVGENHEEAHVTAKRKRLLRDERRARPWTEAHAREAWATMCDIAKRRAFEVDPARAALPTPWQRSCETEKDFLVWLASGATGLDAKGVRAAVRLVRDLAEGRKVRETVARVRFFGDDGRRGSVTVDLTPEEALATRDRMRASAGWRGAIVRVTRIRKAST